MRHSKRTNRLDMPGFRNISIAESSVYGSILHRHQQDNDNAYQLPMIRKRGSVGVAAMSVESDASKWSFLKKLLEIEEAHEKKRQAKERLERDLKQAKLQGSREHRAASSGSPGSDKAVDPMAKWCTGQVLTQSTEDEASESDGNGSRLADRGASNASTPRAQHQRDVSQHPHTYLRSKDVTTPIETGSNEESDMRESDAHLVNPNLYASDKRNLRSPSPSMLSPRNSATRRCRSPNVFNHHHHNRHHHHHHHHHHPALMDSPKKEDLENSQLSSVHSLLSSKKPARQLRLPPLLLPKVHTVKPRPLKHLEYPTPTKLRGPITETEWEDLSDCRYLRQVTSRKPRLNNHGCG